MRMWPRLWRRFSVSEPVRRVSLALSGWNEDAPSMGVRIWRDAYGDVLSLSIPEQPIAIPTEPAELRKWCRSLAEERGAGLIEAFAVDGALGPAVRLIYKRLQIPAYIYTGMLFTSAEAMSVVWTAVAHERGTTGVREAIVTANLINEGKLASSEDYRNLWARDPYDPEYHGVDRSVLHFISDDASYDEQFPDHPLTTVRRLLTMIPASAGLNPEAQGGSD